MVEDKREEEEQFVAVLDDEAIQTEAIQTEAIEEDEDEKKVDVADDGDHEDDDHEDDEIKAKKPRPSRNERKKKRMERDARELQSLRDRNEVLERRFNEHTQTVTDRLDATELTAYDQRIAATKHNMDAARDLMKKAMEESDGDNFDEALELRDQSRDALGKLVSAKNQFTHSPQTPAPESEEPLDYRHVAQAKTFMNNHTWWDPEGRDEDSRTVLRLDTQLAREDYVPSSPEYWVELEDRIREELPHHFEMKKKAGPKGGPQFSSRGKERPLKKNEVYISRERREAMMEAGKWDDPVARNKMLKMYAEYDSAAEKERA